MLATVITFVDNAIRGLTIGGAIGMFIAYRAASRRGPRDPFPIVARWSALCVALAVILTAAFALP